MTTLIDIYGPCWSPNTERAEVTHYVTSDDSDDPDAVIADRAVRASRLHWAIDGSVKVTIHHESGPRTVAWTAPWPHGYPLNWMGDD